MYFPLNSITEYNVSFFRRWYEVTNSGTSNRLFADHLTVFQNAIGKKVPWSESSRALHDEFEISRGEWKKYIVEHLKPGTNFYMFGIGNRLQNNMPAKFIPIPVPKAAKPAKPAKAPGIKFDSKRSCEQRSSKNSPSYSKKELVEFAVNEIGKESKTKYTKMSKQLLCEQLRKHQNPDTFAGEMNNFLNKNSKK